MVISSPLAQRTSKLSPFGLRDVLVAELSVVAVKAPAVSWNSISRWQEERAVRQRAAQMMLFFILLSSPI